MFPQLGPLAAYTRDDHRYWNRKPDDHNVVGLFDIGRWEKTGHPVSPQEHRPSHYHEVKTGNAHTAPAHETREAALQRMDSDKQRRLRRMSLGVTGAFTGRNRRAA
jgi:hypothetical protein